MVRIHYFISSHGYGHATRSSQLILALLTSPHIPPTTNITIITTAPTHLFPSSPRVSFVKEEVDSAVVQPRPYSIDARASFTNLAAFFSRAETDEEWRGRIDRILQERVGEEGDDVSGGEGCDIILSDAPWIIGHLVSQSKSRTGGRKKRPAKSVLVTNFTFDAIFEKLLTYLPAGEGRNSEETKMVHKIESMYAKYDYVIRLPGWIPFPFVEKYWSAVQREKKVIDVPLVFRPARRSREEVLQSLGVPVEKRTKEWKVLLVQFGGQISADGGEAGEKKVPNLPDGWICLSGSGQEMDDERFFTFPGDVYSPDLVGAADVVLGKFGYGTMSECVGMNKPLVYVLRPMFAEEPGLLKYMGENGSCEEISVEDYENGNWAETIERAIGSYERKSRGIVEEGSAEVARIIARLISED